MLQHNLSLLIVALLGVFITTGISRMTFGILTPLFEQNLLLSVTKIGFIATANFIGYFIGALFANYFYERYNLKKIIIIVAAGEIIAMMVMALSSNYLIIACFFLLVGLFSALGYMSVMSFIANNINPKYKGRALGIAISGNSLGIVFSGTSVYVFTLFNNYSFGHNYAVFIVAIIIAAIVIYALLNFDLKISKTDISTQTNKEILTNNNFWKMATIYVIYAISYTIFITYFIGIIIENFTVDIDIASHFWFILGAISIFSGIVFGFIADKYGVYIAMIVSYIMQSLAALLLIMGFNSSIIIYLSIILFGLALWSVPSLMFMLSNNYFGKENTTKATALVTIIFGVGQIIGPITGGLIYDTFNSYNNVFGLLAIMAAIAAILSTIFANEKNFVKI